jgi:hypothetical protein
MKHGYRKGDQVTWQTQFSSTMAGTVVFVGFTTLDVERVDGGKCCISASRCKIATPDDIDRAIAEFIV